MKTFKFLTIIVSLSLIDFSRAVPCEGDDCVDQQQQDPPSDEYLIPSDSNCEHPTPTHCDICEDEYVYECVPKWIPYNLDDAPATDGLFAGNYLGDPIFVGRGIYADLVGAARIAITDPRGAYLPWPGSEIHISNPAKMGYLQNDDNYLFKWVASGNGSYVPFAVDTGDCDADDGIDSYVSKNELSDGSITIGIVTPITGNNFYTDFNGDFRIESEYVVLTCKSKVYEPQPTCPIVIPSPSEEPAGPTPPQCVNEWKPFNGDDAPTIDGLSAGFYDADSEAYIGKVSDGSVDKPGRILLNEAGVLTTSQGYNFMGTENAQYLVYNPSYTYRWVDSNGEVPIPNAVRIEFNPNGVGFKGYISRAQINGEIQVGAGYALGLFPSDTGRDVFTDNFQVLVCDPEPSCPCEAKWIPYLNDLAPETDGFAFGYINDEINYIGRAVQKHPEGFSTVIGRVDLTEGVWYLNDASGSEKLEADEGEYLWKNPDSTYEWVSRHTDNKVWNALKVPIRCENSTLCESSIGCDEDGRSAYIGRATVDGVSYVGTVYKNEGLVIADSCGNKMTLSNFEVLTCATSGRCHTEKEQQCGETPCKWQED